MPIYEYECHDCHRRVSLLVLRPSAAASPTCPRCGGSALSRLMSRFATVKSEEARLDALTDSSSLDDLGDDFESAMDEAMEEGEAAGEGDAESTGPSDASDDL